MPHLLYAYDTLIFCGAEVLGAVSQPEIATFEAISGLHIKMVKSNIYPANEVPEVEELATTMGCDIGSFPTKCLGLPLWCRVQRSTNLE